MTEEKIDKPVAAGVVYAPDTTRRKAEGKRFVFTSAQNNTYVHRGFLAALQRFCAANDAQLIVSTFTYNKNGFQNGEKSDDSLWYDPEIREYIIDESLQITPELIFCGELNILPTAVNPLSGFDAYCRSASGIIPHAKVALKSLPGVPNSTPRMLYTTGAITLRNYIQKKAGQKAEFHHVFGALYVEIDDEEDFFARQLIADSTGAFQDLTTKYPPNDTDDILYNQRVEAVNWGDIHIEKFDPQVLATSFAPRTGILDTLNPRFQFIHDLSDFATRNHHNIKDPHFLAQELKARRTVESGLRSASYFLQSIHRDHTQTVVVESNHDLAYKRWLKDADVRNDPINAQFFHESNAKVYSEIAAGNNEFNVFEWALRKFFPLEQVQFLTELDSFVICKDTGGIECALHGHLGPNGSRGTPNNLRSLGVKVNTGHTHTAGIIDGVYTAGVSAKLYMGYNKGPSSWSHSHIVTYPNGKRTIITLKNGKWRA